MNDTNDPVLPAIDLEARIAALSPEKRALLAKRLMATQSATQSAVQPRPGEPLSSHIARRPRQTQLPLSFAQQRLWFLDQWESGAAVYNIARAWWLRGPLDVPRMRAALAALIARHQSLRTAFSSDRGEPRQLVLDDLSPELPLVDLSSLPEEQARAHALAQAQVLARQGFDLAQPPLLRLAAFRVAESTHLMVLVMHHIVTDGWSMGVLCRDLAAFYSGQEASLPALPVQYPDYAVWQRHQLQGTTLERQVDYWRSRLAGLATLELPTDRPRPPAQSYRGASRPLALSAELSAALRQLGQRERVTPYMLLLASFQVLLARYSGQDDIAVGSPIAGRSQREFEALIGFFVNTLVLRTDFSGNPRFRDLLARVREGALDAYVHQDVPFEKLVEELRPERDLSRSPLIQVMFALQNVPHVELALPGVQITRQDLDTETAKFDLTLSLSEGPTGLCGALEYATDLFEAATIARMAGHFTTLLERIVANPDARIAELPLLTPAERDQLLVQWNDTAVDYLRDHCIHQLFEQQAARTPDAVAIVYENAQLTYAELNTRANQLAHHLIRLGVGPEVLVGLCLERSLELVVGLLAILKAGGAYVPLDPGYPAQRLEFMLADTQAPVLLTQQRLLGQLPRCPAHILCLDRDWAAIAAEPQDNPPCRATADNLAYVIYTSGSTGTPKGVTIEQRSLVNYVLWLQREFGLAAGDRMLQSTPTSFDISILELFWPLVAGATLEIAPPGAHRSASELIGLASRRDITVLQAVPSMLGAIVEEAGFSKLQSLRRVFTAGEALGAELVRRFHARSTAELVNGYGPTETTVYSTFWRCDPAQTRANVPIGRPVANTRIRILDAQVVPVPVGVPGEVYIAGDGVARGYLGRPDLTAERFVADPFARSEHTGRRDRMYRTGDRARYLADGNIEFLGRLDSQVKLRGFRIEPGEIEAVLAQQPRVRNAVVIVREDRSGDPRLVAYVVAQGEKLDTTELRAALKRQLPDHMVPAAFVQLPALPLTPSGKIDHKSLPVAEYGSSDVEYRAPRTPIEQAIAAIWTEVMILPRVGIDDDFFALGGHSLLAIRILNRINRSLEIDLTLRQLFETPTVRGLAQAALEHLLADADREAGLQ